MKSTAKKSVTLALALILGLSAAGCAVKAQETSGPLGQKLEEEAATYPQDDDRSIPVTEAMEDRTEPTMVVWDVEQEVSLPIRKPTKTHIHDYKKGDTVAPTCTEKGYTWMVCECGDKYQEYQDALGHDYQVTDTVKATTEHGGYTVHTCTRCGDTYRDNETDKLEAAPITAPACFVIEDGVSQEMVSSVTYYYKQIPGNVRSSFEGSGWVVTIVSGNLAERMGYSGGIRAMIDPNVKTIYIDNRDASKMSILHEMGHYIDRQVGWTSSSSEFTEIYQEEVDAFCSIWSTASANTDTQREYFAEAYEVILLKPEQMLTCCPKTYEYILDKAGSIS